MFCDLSEAICDVAACVAEVTANQPNKQRHIISLTYAAESWAALRASVADTYISQTLSPSLPASFPSLSLFVFFMNTVSCFSQIIAGVTIFTNLTRLLGHRGLWGAAKERNVH